MSEIMNALVPIEAIQPHPRNYKLHPPLQIADLKASHQRFSQYRSVVIWQRPNGEYIQVAGHGIVEAMKERGVTHVRADILPMDTPEEDIEGIMIADNQLPLGSNENEELLAILLQEQQEAGFDLATMGTDDETLRQMLEAMGDEYLAGDNEDPDESWTRQGSNLFDRFVVPPFSVLDARAGYWQERKRAWLALGIKSEIGRGENLQAIAPANDEYRYNKDEYLARIGRGSLANQEKVKKDNGLLGEAEQARSHYKGDTLGAIPPNERDILSRSGKYSNGKSPARCFGQDLMRGEHVVGQNGKRLTWVAGNRPLDTLDETSRKNLAGGRRAADQRSNINDAPKVPPWAHGIGTENMAAGTSIFDPVLCELAYRWFSPPDGVVLDPFAGGSVRGIVAAKTGRQYIGLDLRQEQIEANEAQWESIKGISTSTSLVPVKISAASARLLFHGCEPGYIRDVCQGRCCESSTSPTGTLITIHPRDEYKIQQRGGVVVDGLLQPRQGEKKCPFKTEVNLCGLHFTDDKPFGCIASPFTLHTSGDTLIVRNRYKSLVCFKDDRDGEPQPAYKAFRASLDLIFGKDEAERICTHLDTDGGDITAYMSRQNYDILRDNDAIKKGPVSLETSTKLDGDQPTPKWIVGDSRNLSDFCAGIQADLVFTCPPYYDLEMYSDNPDDLSVVSTYSEFIEDYRAILKQAIAHLKVNRFVCIVVGDIRDKKGFYRNFVSDTITACQDAGTKLYNEAILVTSVGSLPIRVGKQFSSGRKLGKTHQNVLVFCKGDPRKAVEACGDIVVEVLEDEEEIAAEEELVNV